MRQSYRRLVVAMAAIPMLHFGGCRDNPFQVTVPFDLGGSLGTFEVAAGEPTQNAGTGDLTGSGITIGSGAMKIEAEDVSFVPADSGSGKGTQAHQDGGATIVVSGGIAAGADIDTVCDAPVDEYGPYTIVLNEDFEVVSITPDEITLEESTIALLNAGQISICLTVESDVDGTLTIDQLTFDLGL